MTPDADVAVVGAGVAGLTCAAAIRAAGRSCVLLEAAPRIGGRAWTTFPKSLRGAAFDQGASWLHAAERNPLCKIARAARERLLNADANWSRHIVIDGRPATKSEVDGYVRAENEYERVIDRWGRIRPDRSMAEAAEAMLLDPWLATVESFEATLIAAADARDASVWDARINALWGSNLNVVGGLGAFVARRLAQDAVLNTAVRAITWGKRGMALDTDAGMMTAAACVVTVSTGVLRAGHIAFTPKLPETHREALNGLPMGVLTKVAFGAMTDDRFDLPEHCVLRARLPERHAPAFSFLVWPFGERHVIGFIGGRHALELSRLGTRATESFARSELRALLGSDAARKFSTGVVADWVADRLHLGAYAYATPGHAGARAVLAKPLAGGRFVFAGEAVAGEGLAGTVGGAYRSGEDAAEIVLAALPPR